MSGHGHVTPNPDGSKARCGGPAICSACAKELARQCNALADVRSATILKPGDRVLVDLGRPATPQDMDRIADTMKLRFPDVEFTFLCGAESVLVKPAEEPADD